MTQQQSFALAFLEQVEKLFSEPGIPTLMVPATEDAPFASLVARFDALGESEEVVDLQLSFLPLPPETEAENAHILQSFVELSSDVDRERLPELMWLTSTLNSMLPIGTFGILEKRGVLFFKHNALIDGNLDLHANVKLVDRQTGLFLYVLSLYIDTVLQVARGEADAHDALESTPFAQIF